jgi:hypothetical protein
MKKLVGIISTGARGREPGNGEPSKRSRTLAEETMMNPAQDDIGFDGNPQPNLNSPEELAKAEREFDNEHYHNH